jgi:hypothetical protein
MRQGPEPFAQRSIVRASGLIAHAGPVTANDTARPPLAYLIGCTQMRDSLAVCDGRHHFFPSKSFSAALSSMASARSRFSRAFSSFRRLQPLGLGNLQATVFGLPFVKAGVAHSVFATQLSNRNSSLLLLQNPDDLLFRKPAALHSPVLLSVRILPSFGGN